MSDWIVWIAFLIFIVFLIWVYNQPKERAELWGIIGATVLITLLVAKILGI